MARTAAAPAKRTMLDRIESLGNKVPHPAMIFLGLCGLVIVLSAILAGYAGLVLSFLVRRRRIFVRAYGDESGRTTVEVAGLARSDVGGGFEGEFAELSRDLREQLTASRKETE